MSLNLFSILKNVLNESIDAQSVNHAIDTKSRIVIRYNDEGGKEGKGRAEGPRYIEPYVYGFTKAGNPCFRAYQYDGDTFRGNPKWKLFLLKRVMSWEELDSHFVVEPRENGWNAEEYNRNGDDSMSEVINQVHFDDNDTFEPNSSVKTARNNSTGPVFNDSLDNELSNMVGKNREISDSEAAERAKKKAKKQKKNQNVANPLLHLNKGESWNSKRHEDETSREYKNRMAREKRAREKEQQEYEDLLASMDNGHFDMTPYEGEEDDEEFQGQYLGGKARKMLHKK